MSERIEDHERIYLEPPPGTEYEGRMWCQDKIEDDWTEYVRVERLAALQARVEELEETLERELVLFESLDDPFTDLRRPPERDSVVTMMVDLHGPAYDDPKLNALETRLRNIVRRLKDADRTTLRGEGE